MATWREYVATAASAVAVGGLLALVLSGRSSSVPSPDRLGPPVPTRPTQAPVARDSSFPTTAATPPLATPPPSATALSVAAALKPLVATRVIAGTTLLVVRANGVDGTTLVGVPVTTSPTLSASGIPLVSFGRSGGWQVRPDGQVLAASLETAQDSARIATWNLRSGALSWVTPDESAVRSASTAWSADGSLLYYASSHGTTDLGIRRIRSDGSANTLVRRPDSKGTIELRGLTPDGTGLVFSYSRPGGSVDIFDLVTGTDRAFDDNTPASVTAWRATRPRALVLVGGGAGQPAPTLMSWDDIAGTKKVLLGPTLPESPTSVYGADFDATGTRIAVAVYNKIDGGELLSAIHIMDANGGGRTPVPGSDGALSVLWFRAGLVYTKANAAGGTDIMLIQPTGGVPVTLYSDPGQIGRLAFVSP